MKEFLKFHFVNAFLLAALKDKYFYTIVIKCIYIFEFNDNMHSKVYSRNFQNDFLLIYELAEVFSYSKQIFPPKGQ